MTLPKRRSVTYLLVALSLAGSTVAADPAASADEIDRARREVGRKQTQVAEFRRQYEALVSQVEIAKANLEAKQTQIVANTLALTHHQEALAKKSAEFGQRVRTAYKEGPADAVGLILSARNLGQLQAATRYLGNRLARDRALVEEMKAEEAELASISTRLEVDRAAIGAEVDKLADLIDATQAALADAEVALAASESDLRIKEELKKALDLVNAGSAGRRPISERHRIATEAQEELLKKYPFGPVSGVPPGLRATGDTFEGIASWYGPGFDGLPTASGAIYDQNLYTTAHKTLPFKTILLVTYQDRSVLVLVNDRGPFVAGRVLDLSRASKDAIGMGGLGYVRAEILEPA